MVMNFASATHKGGGFLICAHAQDLCAVATVPAPNLRSMKVYKPDLTIMMLRRIRYFLSMVAHRGYKNLILGAWGYGAFRHNPYDVAQYFHKVLIDEGFAVLFDTIAFAIVKSQDNLQAFQDVFSCKNNEDIQELRRKEDREIMMHLHSIEEIIKMKCSRCDNLLGCLGCNLRELQQDIEHARKMMGFQNE